MHVSVVINDQASVMVSVHVLVSLFVQVFVSVVVSVQVPVFVVVPYSEHVVAKISFEQVQACVRIVVVQILPCEDNDVDCRMAEDNGDVRWAADRVDDIMRLDLGLRNRDRDRDREDDRVDSRELAELSWDVST